MPKIINAFQIALFIFSVQFLAPSVFAAEVTARTTPAGHKYWHYPVAKAKRSAVVITWPTSIAKLPKGQEMAGWLGVNIMLNGGAGGKSPDEIIADFGDLDAGSRLFITPEEIRGFIVTPNKEAFKAAEIANMVLRTPTFSKKWFKRQRGGFVKGSRKSDRQVLGIGWNLSREIMMPGHPYKNFFSLKSRKKIKQIKLATIKSWHANAFATGDIKIVAAGSSDFKNLGAAIDKALEGLPSGSVNKKYTPLNIKVPGKTIIFHAPKASKSMILTFGKAPSARQLKDVEMNLSLGVLGYGSQSRLFKAVRTGLRASYGFKAGFVDYTRSQRLFHMSGEVETAKLQAALDTVRDTYEEFRTGGIGIIEFPFARKYYRERIEGSLIKPRNAAYLMMDGLLNGAPKNQLTSLKAHINSRTRGGVNKFIAKTFAPFDKLLTIIVTPDAKAVKGDCIITAYSQWKTCF